MRLGGFSVGVLALATVSTPAAAQEAAAPAAPVSEAQVEVAAETPAISSETQLAALGPGIAADPTRARIDPSEVDARIGSTFDLTGNIGLASNYHYRGLTLSGNQPTAQTTIELSHRSGLYAAAFGAKIAETAGAKFESDLTLGWSGDVGPVKLDAGVTGYHYPGGSGLDYFELGIGATRAIGPVEVSVAANYAPTQSNLGGDNFYMGLGADFSLGHSPFSLTGWVGRETGAFASFGRAKLDWAAGVGLDLGPFNMSVAWRDTNVARLLDPEGTAKGRLVIETSFGF